MKRILFVDDEPRLLAGLQRMLRGMRNEWDMAFVGGGQEALDAMHEKPFDVIVSDLRMPGMDGIQLFAEVKSKYPQTVRLILSGASEKEVMMKSVNLAHQVIAKPCDAKVLKAIIKRSWSLQNILADNNLKTLVAGMKSLPSLPSLYLEIMDELKSSSSSITRVGKIISKDVSMTAKILQLINSAFFGLPRHVASTEQAAVLLGIETIKSLVLTVNIFSEFGGYNCGKLSIESIWKHSLATAGFARKIYRIESKDRIGMDLAFMAGMLHDVGMILLATNMTERYDEALDRAANKKLHLSQVEMKLLKVTHAEVGAYLLGLWGLPDMLVDAVCFHHSPQNSASPLFSPVTAVHAADVIESECHESHPMGAPPKIKRYYLHQLGVLEKLPEWRQACLELTEKGGNNE